MPIGVFSLSDVNIFLCLWSGPSEGSFLMNKCIFSPFSMTLSVQNHNPPTEIHLTRWISSRASKKCVTSFTQFCYQDHWQTFLRAVETISTFPSSNGITNGTSIRIHFGAEQIQTVPCVDFSVWSTNQENHAGEHNNLPMVTFQLLI